MRAYKEFADPTVFDASVPLTSILTFLYCFLLIFANYPGIGYALAREFLKAGDNVVICSRSGNICTIITMIFPS